jgi:hypothetical protein
MTAPTRSELISRHLSVSRAYSPAAEALVDRFQFLYADTAGLEPAEQARLLAEMQVQIAGQLANLLR